MSCACSVPDIRPDPIFRRALWLALVLNLSMFLIEGLASFHSGSVSLLADAVDFFGDSANYALSLSVLSLGMLWRGRAALLKGVTMTAFGMFVLGRVVWSVQVGATPDSLTMGAVGFLALLVNTLVALMLFRFRSGDADMRSVWLCSRNDALGNIAVVMAAFGVFGTGSAWPDLLVAVIIGGLALSSGVSVMRHARSDIRESRSITCSSQLHPSRR